MTYMLQIPERNQGVPRWATEMYEGVDADIQNWLFSYYFWEFWDKHKDTANMEDVAVLARTNAESRLKALMQTRQLKNAADRSLLLQLYEAHKTGWYRFIHEIEDVRELLDHLYNEAYEDNPFSSSRYEYEFLVKTLIPTLEQLGVKKEIIVQIPQNIGKARAAISTMRQIITENDDHKEEKLMEVLTDICDPSITFREFKRKNAERMHKNRDIPKAEMHVCIVPEGDLIVLKCPPGITQAIENSINGLADDAIVTDPAELLRYVSDAIMPKRKRDEQKQRLSQIEKGQ